MRRVDLVDPVGEKGQGERIERGKMHDGVLLRMALTQVAAQLCHGKHQICRSMQEVLAFRRQAYRVGFSVKKRYAKPFFQLLNLSAQRGLGDVSFTSGSRKAIALRHTEKIFKPLQFHQRTSGG